MEMELVTGPAAEPVTATEAKAWARVTSSAEDTLFGLLISTAREKLELLTGRKFINQTWRFWFDGFPGSAREREAWWDGVREGAVTDVLGRQPTLELPMAPASSISSVKYYSLDNTENTFDSGSYFLAKSQNAFTRLALNDGYLWPDPSSLRLVQAVKIEGVFGYGAAGSSVPEPIKSAIKVFIAHMFENRGDDEKALKVPPIAMNLLEPYIIRRL